MTVFLLKAQAQSNSPFTRYGIGEVYSNPHAVSRSMGGLSAAYADGGYYKPLKLSLNFANLGQSVNFNNPATYGGFYMSTLDLGVYIDSRNLSSKNPSGKFGSADFLPAYLAIGVPLNRKKGWGLALGLKPLSRIGYSVQSNSRTAGDSLQTLYEGSGGINQAFVGLAKKWRGLSIGFNTGYNFGNKDVSTKKSFINDSVFYYSSNSATKTHFGGMFFTAGMQYEVTLSSRVNEIKKTTEQYHLRFGLSGTVGQTMNASSDIDKQTFIYSSDGAEARIDSVSGQDDIKGKVFIPGTYAAGVTLHKTAYNSRGLFELWSIGLEYTATQWTKYRFYDQPDQLADSWQVKLGVQFAPDPLAGRNLWNSVNYRAGAFVGKDYLNPDGNGLKLFGVSLGAGIPVRKWSSYSDQFTMINTAIQFGKRGSSVNNVTETYFAFVLGFSLSDLWFTKRQYD